MCSDNGDVEAVLEFIRYEGPEFAQSDLEVRVFLGGAFSTLSGIFKILRLRTFFRLSTNTLSGVVWSSGLLT